MRSLPLGAQLWTPAVFFGLVLGSNQIRHTQTQGILGRRCVCSGDGKITVQDWRASTGKTVPSSVSPLKTQYLEEGLMCSKSGIARAEI